MELGMSYPTMDVYGNLCTQAVMKNFLAFRDSPINIITFRRSHKTSAAAGKNESNDTITHLIAMTELLDGDDKKGFAKKRSRPN